MKTDELVSLLAANSAPVAPRAVERRLLAALTSGVAVALLGLLIIGLHRDLADAARLPMFWMRLGLPALIAVLAATVMCRLARPGMQPGPLLGLAAIPVAAFWVYCGMDLMRTPENMRTDVILADSWFLCPLGVILLALPVFGFVIHALRSMAPTRLRLAGAVAGLLAGATGAAVYALHCSMLAAPFVGVWYAIGIGTPALCGWLAGPRLLRW